MWYFTWILGVLLAVALVIINALWFEAEQYRGKAAHQGDWWRNSF